MFSSLTNTSKSNYENFSTGWSLNGLSGLTKETRSAYTYRNLDSDILHSQSELYKTQFDSMISNNSQDMIMTYERGVNPSVDIITSNPTPIGGTKIIIEEQTPTDLLPLSRQKFADPRVETSVKSMYYDITNARVLDKNLILEENNTEAIPIVKYNINEAPRIKYNTDNLSEISIITDPIKGVIANGSKPASNMYMEVIDVDDVGQYIKRTIDIGTENTKELHKKVRHFEDRDHDDKIKMQNIILVEGFKHANFKKEDKNNTPLVPVSYFKTKNDINASSNINRKLDDRKKNISTPKLIDEVNASSFTNQQKNQGGKRIESEYFNIDERKLLISVDNKHTNRGVRRENTNKQLPVLKPTVFK